MRRLCEENAWLRDELANTQLKLQQSEEKVATLEGNLFFAEMEKKEFLYMRELGVRFFRDSIVNGSRSQVSFHLGHRC